MWNSYKLSCIVYGQHLCHSHKFCPLASQRHLKIIAYKMTFFFLFKKATRPGFIQGYSWPEPCVKLPDSTLIGLSKCRLSPYLVACLNWALFTEVLLFNKHPPHNQQDSLAREEIDCSYCSLRGGWLTKATEDWRIAQTSAKLKQS